MILAYLIRVEGLVQGVGFRFYTKKKADELQLTGTVENNEDGSVSIYIKGEASKVKLFLLWCHYGPASGRVDKMEYEHAEIKDIDSFEIKR